MRFHASGQHGSNLFATYFDALPLMQADKHRETARFLQITEQTLRRYLCGHSEPPPSMVALLWHESPHGRAVLDEHAHRGMLYAQAEARELREQAERLRARVRHLERELDETRAAATENRPRLICANQSVFQVA